MIIENFTIKWFTIYYAVIGLLLLCTGGWLLAIPGKFKSYLVKHAEVDDPPALLRTILKYLFLFTLPCLVLSFFPFRWTELLFSIWSLLIVYFAGAQLVRWPELRIILLENKNALSFFIRWMGVIMMSAALVILLLGYLVIQQAQLL